jgi:PAS domain-containing protein
MTPPPPYDARIAELEQILRRERFRLTQALALSGAGAWEWVEATDELWWQPSLFDLYGVNPKTFRGRYSDFENALAPEEIERVRRCVTEANTKGEHFRLIFRARNGRTILGIGRMENGVMHGINVDAGYGACDDCPKMPRAAVNAQFPDDIPRNETTRIHLRSRVAA